MVDATLMRYHPDIYSDVLARQDAAERRMTEDTFAGLLRFVRNWIGYDADLADFIQSLDGSSRRWPHRGLDLAVSARTCACIAHAAGAGVGVTHITGPTRLSWAGQPIGETFSRTTAFLRLAAEGSSLSRI